VLTRRNVLTLSAAERKAFVDALLALKKKGRYDWYVRTHVETMMKVAAFPYEPQDMNYRNRAHSGPVFLPWHRKLLAELEADLRKIDKSLALPYWDWSVDGDSADPKASALWADDLMGGDGTGAGDVVETGPFAGKAGNWPIDPKLDPDNTGPALVRKFQTIVTSLPTSEHVKFLMREAFYDVPPLSAASVAGFRNRLEGWLTRRLDYRYTTEGSQMHNRVHLWVGGNMITDASPNDPVFFLHHCFIDKLWSDWQRKMVDSMPGMTMPREDYYNPGKDGPPGHNLNDAMFPWKTTPRDVLDPEKMGYRYDTDPVPAPKRKPKAVAGHDLEAMAAMTATAPLQADLTLSGAADAGAVIGSPGTRTARRWTID
jgi:tyrosinase